MSLEKIGSNNELPKNWKSLNVEEVKKKVKKSKGIKELAKLYRYKGHKPLLNNMKGPELEIGEIIAKSPYSKVQREKDQMEFEELVESEVPEYTKDGKEEEKKTSDNPKNADK